MILHGMEHHFSHSRSAVSPAPPPNLFLPTHSTLTGAAGRETEKTLMLRKHCLAVAKTLMCYRYCLGYKSETQKQTTSTPAKYEYLLLLN